MHDQAGGAARPDPVTSLVPRTAPQAEAVAPRPQATEEDVARVRRQLDNAVAASTRAAYGRDWQAFVTWCATRRPTPVGPLPAAPESVALYLAELAEGTYVRAGRTYRYAAATIRRRAAAVTYVHEQAGLASPLAHPVVRRVLAGVSGREDLSLSTLPDRQKRGLLTDDLRLLVAQVPAEGLVGARDRCLLLLTYAAGGRRRSEVAALDVEHVRDEGEQLRVLMWRSKRNRTRRREEYLARQGSRAATCPVGAYRAWTAALAAALNVSVASLTGPLFRPVDRYGRLGSPRRPGSQTRLSPQAVALVVKRYAAAAGLDPAQVAAHSLRRGFVTQALRNGVPRHKVREATGHALDASLQPYIAAVDRDTDPASGHLGL
ncbi:MAG: tyrosine-type recombinase/integrase [Actinomycetes bacterium]